MASLYKNRPAQSSCCVYHELIRVIKSVIDTKTFGLKAEPRVEDQMNWSKQISVIVIGRETLKQELV